MNVHHHPFLLERSGDRDIRGHWHVPTSGTKGTVLFLHGYKGYMDWGAWYRVGDRFASAGVRLEASGSIPHGRAVAGDSHGVPAVGAGTVPEAEAAVGLGEAGREGHQHALHLAAHVEAVP